MARVYQLDRSLVSKVEGRIGEVRERVTKGGAAAVVQRPVDFIADAAGVSRSTVQRWIRDAHRAERSTERSPRAELLRDFADSFDVLCRASVQPIERSLITIASDPKHARCVDAARFMLPRLDPIGEGPSEAEHREREATVADIPQEVFDELTAVERARMAEIAEAIDELDRETHELLGAAARRSGVELDAIDCLASS